MAKKEARKKAKSLIRRAEEARVELNLVPNDTAERGADVIGELIVELIRVREESQIREERLGEIKFHIHELLEFAGE